MSDNADIARAVTEKRKRLFRYAREHDLALLAVGHMLARLGIDYLDDEVILVDAKENQIGIAICPPQSTGKNGQTANENP